MQEVKVAVQAARKNSVSFFFFLSVITLLVSRLVLRGDCGSIEVWQQIEEWKMKCLQMYASDFQIFRSGEDLMQ